MSKFGQTDALFLIHLFNMEDQPVPRVTGAERLNNGVLITFDDDRCAFYSASLLRETLVQAQTISDEIKNEESPEYLVVVAVHISR